MIKIKNKIIKLIYITSSIVLLMVVSGLVYYFYFFQRIPSNIICNDSIKEYTRNIKQLYPSINDVIVKEEANRLMFTYDMNNKLKDDGYADVFDRNYSLILDNKLLEDENYSDIIIVFTVKDLNFVYRYSTNSESNYKEWDITINELDKGNVTK